MRNDGSEAQELHQSNVFEIERATKERRDLLEVVRDCVNFLADLNSTSPFDAEYMEHRAKALHKRAYTAHSKAKEK